MTVDTSVVVHHLTMRGGACERSDVTFVVFLQNQDKQTNRDVKCAD